MGKKARMRNLSRKPAREPYAKVLVVCEGEKTEPNYFRGLKNLLRLSSANVEIVGAGATPVRIVEHAKKLYEEEKGKGDPFDKVFCVFDKDEHADYQRALNKLNSMNDFSAIYSVPCFEYWILLHYEYTTRPYQKAGNKSAADKVVSDLKRHITDYRKGAPEIFKHCRDKLENAKNNAEKSLKAAQKANTENPSTKAHELVQFMQDIKNP